MTEETHAAEPSPPSEKALYLEEFRGRTLGILLVDVDWAAHPGLLPVLDELRQDRARVVLVVPAGAPLADLDCEVLAATADPLAGRVWRALRRRGRVALETESHPFSTFLEVARRLALYKVIRLADVDGFEDAAGRRHPFVDLGELVELLSGEPLPPRVELLREVEQLLAAGIPNVNLCTVAGLHDELFTYSGSGTLFTRGGHIVVRQLGVDDFDSADDLIARGVAEGYLAARSSDAVDRLLADGYGAFVEGRHLAGIAALRVPTGAAAGEVAGLYALTRFVGEGVGANLVSYALGKARAQGLGYVYACTTSERAAEFFRRQGFLPVSQNDVPAEKWRDYDPERRKSVVCLRFDL